MTHTSYPKVNPPDVIGELLTQYHIAQDLKLLRDLIIEVIAKGLYPIIYTKQPQLTMEKIHREGGFLQPFESELKLLTKEELEEIGIDYLEYTGRVFHTLNEFFQSSPTTARNKE